jgi:hypothetical protein
MSFNERDDWSKGVIAYGAGPMSEAELVGRATYLFGKDWRRALAAKGRVHYRTVRRWQKHSVPGPAAAMLRALWMEKRFKEAGLM